MSGRNANIFYDDLTWPREPDYERWRAAACDSSSQMGHPIYLPQGCLDLTRAPRHSQVITS